MTDTECKLVAALRDLIRVCEDEVACFDQSPLSETGQVMARAKTIIRECENG